MGDHQQALDYYTQSLSIARAIRAPHEIATALFFQARVRRDLGALVEARGLIEDSLEIIESLRARVISQQLRSSLLAARQNHYELYIDLLMGLHQEQPGAGTMPRPCKRANAPALAACLSC